jgi:hypothetical protein
MRRPGGLVRRDSAPSCSNTMERTRPKVCIRRLGPDYEGFHFRTEEGRVPGTRGSLAGYGARGPSDRPRVPAAIYRLYSLDDVAGVGM